jgi:hypothetical protein
VKTYLLIGMAVAAGMWSSPTYCAVFAKGMRASIRRNPVIGWLATILTTGTIVVAWPVWLAYMITVGVGAFILWKRSK